MYTIQFNESTIQKGTWKSRLIRVNTRQSRVKSRSFYEDTWRIFRHNVSLHTLMLPVIVHEADHEVHDYIFASRN